MDLIYRRYIIGIRPAESFPSRQILLEKLVFGRSYKERMTCEEAFYREKNIQKLFYREKFLRRISIEIRA